MDDLDKENRLVLAVVQALLGVISPNFQAVALVRGRSEWTLHVALRREDEVDRDELADVPGEIEAQLLPLDLALTTEVWIGDDWVASDWRGKEGRLIFSARAIGVS